MAHAKSAPSSRLEEAVRRRYATGAAEVEPALCCPVRTYDPEAMRLLPREIVEKDYGCGDPSAYVREGEVVVDLGSGSGKACYLLAQRVGPGGEVTGVDFNDAMLALARRYEDEMARKLGFRNVEFCKARIQDLALDLEKVDEWLRRNPVQTVEAVTDLEAHCESLRREQPLLQADSVDVIVSNCVLNLVKPEDRERLFAEMHRVLRRGGRAVISDIVCDGEPTPSMRADPELWSGCLSGAFREDGFLAGFERAGFHGIEVLHRAQAPWRVVDGLEFRSVTVRAFKGKEGPCVEGGRAVLYRGPWSQVVDDDGHTFARGQRTPVCDKTFGLMTDAAGPYASHIAPLGPETADATTGATCDGQSSCC